jgi:hypothetical protein
MKKFGALGITIALLFFVSCGKQETEAEKNAEIERQVQQRLAGERQAAEQQKLAQREADLNARENALVQKEQEAVQSATPQMRATEIQQRDTAETERQTEPVEEPQSYNTFYTKLEPYGAWRETSNYGYVWQPNDAGRSRNWRPYTNGRWVYTDAGWTWDSEEPFGWATYHYGRWARLRNIGWVWIPGDEWAPAWVSWRKSDDYVGWAPLPPEARFDRNRGIHNWADNYYDLGPEQYAFVPTNDFGEQRIERAIVPIERNVTIVNQTTNVTNITYNNTTIINEGPNYDELLQRTRQPIQRLRLERRARFANENPQTILRGEVIEMSAPAIAPARPADRPRAVKEKLGQAVVDRAWDQVRDKKAAETARAKMKAEATPPSGAPALPNVVRGQPQQTPVPAQSATPVRNLPQRPKVNPRPSITATPAAAPTAAAAAPQSQVREERTEAERRMREAQKAQKEKLRAQEKVQQQKMEELRKAKAAKNQPSPAISARPPVTPPVRPAAPPKSSPAISAAPHAAPFVKPVARPAPPAPSRPPQPPGKASPSVPASASPQSATTAGPKKNDKDKKKNKRGRESPSPSPAAAHQP